MIVIVFNEEKPCRAVVKKIEATLKSIGLPSEKISRYPFRKADLKVLAEAEMAITVGGDGTVLSVLGSIDPLRTKVLPVNFGTLGFVSSVSEGETISLLKAYLTNSENSKKNYRLDYRSFLEVRALGKTFRAYNEILISGGMPGKLLRIDASVNSEKITSFRADGLLVSTATGSTAYNLAAGGPILHPAIEAVIFNPICPHSLTVRPLVIPGSDEVMIQADSSSPGAEAKLIIDGRFRGKLTAKDVVTCHLSHAKFCFVKPRAENYYQILKGKMKWGV